VVISRSSSKDFTVTSTLRGGSRLVVSVSVTRSQITVDINSGYAGDLKWDVLLIGNGIGLDATDAKPKVANGKSLTFDL